MSTGVERRQEPIWSSFLGCPGRPVRRSLVEGPAQVVLLQGELDAASVAALEDDVVLFLEFWNGPLILDLTDVSFVDCSAMGCLARLRHRFAHTGHPITVRNPDPTVRRIVELAGLAALLGFDGTEAGTGAVGGRCTPGMT